MTLAALVESFVAGDTEHGNASALSIGGDRLWSYAYPLAYRGRDVNGNTTVFVNTRLAGFKIDLRDAAYSATTSKHRRLITRAAESANLNVIECAFVFGMPPADLLVNDFTRAA